MHDTALDLTRSDALATEVHLDSPAVQQAFEAYLMQLAECESEFSERLYERFFETCPDAVPLFGVHAISEREEMVRETFRAMLGWIEKEPWLADNLTALGRSHVEYGVEASMYPPFVEVFLETAREITGPSEDLSVQAVMRRALEAITGAMQSSAS